MNSKHLIAQLEDAIAKKQPSQTYAILRNLTDLFLVQAGVLSADRLGIYDDVFSRLIEQIESAARAELANRLARVSGAPKNTIRALALDNDITVAEPVLTHSSDLDDKTLMQAASTKGQQHLLAIANRATISPEVSYRLVQHGETKVLGALAKNAGAKICKDGFELLVEKSKGTDWLLIAVGLRRDIPERHFRSLISQASKTVVQKLKAENPKIGKQIDDLNVVKNLAQDKDSAEPRDYRTADLVVSPLAKSGRLTEADIKEFAQLKKIEETIDAIAQLAGLPVRDIEALIMERWSGPTACVLKSIGVRLDTFNAIYCMRLSAGEAPGADLYETKLVFLGLTEAMADRIMRTYKVRRSVQ